MNAQTIVRARIFRQLMAAIMGSHGVRADAVAPVTSRSRFSEPEPPRPDIELPDHPEIFIRVSSAATTQQKWLMSLSESETDASLAGASIGVAISYRRRADGRADGLAILSVDALSRLIAAAGVRTEVPA